MDLNLILMTVFTKTKKLYIIIGLDFTKGTWVEENELKLK